MTPWKVGIAGCGIIAGGKAAPDPNGPVRSHAQAMTRTGRFAIKAVADSNVERSRAFAATWGADAHYGSVETMLDDTKLDLLVVASPNRHHFEHIKAALTDKNKPSAVFAEKPVCLTPDELAQLKKLQADSTVRVVVNHTRRFDPGHQELAEIIRSGRLGRPVNGKAVYYGGWKHNGIHLVDTLNMLLGSNPAVVSADIAGPGKPEAPDLDVTLDYSGVTVDVESFDEARYQLFEIELRLEYGRIRALDFGSDIHVEEVAVNAIDERELKPCPDYSIKGLDSPMLHAYLTLDRILKGELTESVGLDVAGASMETLWAAETMSKK